MGKLTLSLAACNIALWLGTPAFGQADPHQAAHQDYQQQMLRVQRYWEQSRRLGIAGSRPVHADVMVNTGSSPVPLRPHGYIPNYRIPLRTHQNITVKQAPSTCYRDGTWEICW